VVSAVCGHFTTIKLCTRLRQRCLRPGLDTRFARSHPESASYTTWVGKLVATHAIQSEWLGLWLYMAEHIVRDVADSMTRTVLETSLLKHTCSISISIKHFKIVNHLYTQYIHIHNIL